MTKLLALAASYRSDSINRDLLAIAVELAKKAGARVTVLDYTACEAPFYRGETVVDRLPDPIEALSMALRSHDGILLASPEYNWSIPGGLKNIIDWLSIDPRAPLNGKSALLMSATPSVRCGISGLQQLRTPLDVLGMWTYPQLIGIGRVPETLQNGQLTREADQQHLSFCVQDFVRMTKAMTHA